MAQASREVERQRQAALRAQVQAARARERAEQASQRAHAANERESKRLYAEARADEAAALEAELNAKGESLEGILAATLDPTNNTRTFAYDPLGRLTGYSDDGGTTVTDYGWATVLNRTSVQTTGSSAVATTYDAANRPLDQAGVTDAFGSDADGRLTRRPDATGTAWQRFTWDDLGRLTSVTNDAGTVTLAGYTYDPLDRLRMVDYGAGNRVRFRYLGLTTSAVQTIDDATGSVTRHIGSAWTGEHLEDWTGSGQNLRIYGTNGHHDLTWTAGSSGSVTGTVRYDPWGTAASVTGSVPDFRFQGSYADDTTKLSWAVTRWYAAAQGRFISEDSLLGEPKDPDSRHLYAYAEGDAVRAWDPDGQWSRVAWHTVNLSLWESRAFAGAVYGAVGLICVAAAALGQVESVPWCLVQLLAGPTLDDPNRVESQAVKHQEIWRNTSGQGQMLAYHTKIGVRTVIYKWGRECLDRPSTRNTMSLASVKGPASRHEHGTATAAR